MQVLLNKLYGDADNIEYTDITCAHALDISFFHPPLTICINLSFEENVQDTLVNFLNLFNLLIKKTPYNCTYKLTPSLLLLNQYTISLTWTIINVQHSEIWTHTRLTISAEIYLNPMIRHFLFTIYFLTAEINVDNSIELEQQNVSK